MGEERMVRIDEAVTIPLSEIEIVAGPSSGPGGQHVNKVSTRITLRFDVLGSPSLDDSGRRRILERLATRIGKDGRLRVVCGRHRSRAANREEAIERFAALLQDALRPRKRRIETRVPRDERRRRLEEKRRRSERKRERGSPRDDDR